MKNIYFILFLLTISSTNIICFDDMIAMLPSLRTSLKNKNNLKATSINNTHSNSTVNITKKQKDEKKRQCDSLIESMKLDKEIEADINQIKSMIYNRSIQIEVKIKSSKNQTEIKENKKELAELVHFQKTKLKEIEDLFNQMKKISLELKDEYCKVEVLKQLINTKENINALIQTMKTVSKIGVDDEQLFFLEKF